MTVTKPEPVLALEQRFQHIAHTRMADMPLNNPALRVEAVGFERHAQGWLGILVTPWSMNLLLLPFEPPAGNSGDIVTLTLWDEVNVSFTLALDEALGAYLSCSLFSPAQAFTHQAAARATALEVLRQLRPAPRTADEPENPARRRLFSLR